ncbi:MAG TPA: energy-coupled thiamine transporter ThiT [Bacillales bacterium]|nr:energy-coupled thiamine transporter ThiT [Bacillales bacterium]
MNLKRTRLITETAVMVALAVVLSYVKFDAPWAYGGSISLEMVPILLMAFRRGVEAGLVTGLIFGIVNFLLNPYLVHPVSILVDYPLAFLLVGIAGVFRLKAGDARLLNGARLFLGTLLGSGLRFAAHFVSGIVWWGSYAPEGTPVVVYSLVYNLGYMIPSFLLSAVVLILLYFGAPKLFQASES